MRIIIAWALSLGTIATAGFSAVNHRRESLHGAGASSDCSSCHEGSVQQTHVSEFLLESHGPAARIDRESCMGCHEREGCDECHLREAPLWHTEEFRNPGRGAKERGIHSSEAMSRRSDCLECHATRLFVQCGECHDPLEWR